MAIKGMQSSLSEENGYDQSATEEFPASLA
jgi:hypothetical protein